MDGRVLREGDRARMSEVQPLPLGPCEPTALHRVGQVAAVVLLMTVFVL
jgi:hypothetical protein